MTFSNFSESKISAMIDFEILLAISRLLNIEGLVLGANEYPQTSEPRPVSHNASQLPLNPVCPVKKTFLFL